MKMGPWGRRAASAPEPEPESDGPPPADLEAAPSQYPCRSCGAMLAYAPGETHLTCAFCGATTEVAGVSEATRSEALREHCLRTALSEAPGAAPTETTQVIRCDACGATVEFDPDEHAATCPFCATPVVADAAPDRHIRPQAVLPFAIDARQARETVRAWLGRLWFAPNGLKKYARTEKGLNGVYTPYWTYDARTESAYVGQRGDVYYVTVRNHKGETSRVARVRWRPASGRVRRDFDDVLALGSASLPKDYADALAPWDLSDLRPYARDWLAGFRAESYTIDLAQGYEDARAQMDAVIRQDVRRAIGGDRQRIQRLDTQARDVTFKHILLPVWVGAYRWRGKPYRIVINGRTGAVRGERPYSIWKIALAVVAALLLLGAVAVLTGGLR